MQYGPGAGGAIVAEQGFAAEEATHDTGEILELGCLDTRDTEHVLELRDASSQSEHEPAVGQNFAWCTRSRL